MNYAVMIAAAFILATIAVAALSPFDHLPQGAPQATAAATRHRPPTRAVLPTIVVLSVRLVVVLSVRLGRPQQMAAKRGAAALKALQPTVLLTPRGR